MIDTSHSGNDQKNKNFLNRQHIPAYTLNPKEKFQQHNGSLKSVSIMPIGLLGQPSADTIGVSDMGYMTEANRTRNPISGSVGTVPNIQPMPVLSDTFSRIFKPH